MNVRFMVAGNVFGLIFPSDDDLQRSNQFVWLWRKAANLSLNYFLFYDRLFVLLNSQF